MVQEEAEHLATSHPVRAMEVLVQFDGISVEWEELKRTLQGCEDSLMVASRLQSFIQVQSRKKWLLKGSSQQIICFHLCHTKGCTAQETEQLKKNQHIISDI